MVPVIMRRSLSIWDFNLFMKCLKSVCFCLLVTVLFNYVCKVVARKSVHTESIDEFFGGSKKYDLLAFGASYVYATVVPPQLYRDFGIRSYVLASPSQPINETFYFVKRALIQYNPKVVLVGVDMVVRSAVEYVHKSEAVHEATDGFPWGEEKFALIANLNTSGSLDEFFAPIIKYHSRWKELKKYDFLCESGRQHFNGHVFYPVANYTNDVVSYDLATSHRSEIYKENIEWLERIHMVCQKQGVRLCLLSSPRHQGPADGRLASLHDWADVHNVDFIDLNLDLYKAGISNDLDFHDFGHLNVLGAEKATRYIGGHLAKLCQHDKRVFDDGSAGWWSSEVLRYGRSCLKFHKVKPAK